MNVVEEVGGPLIPSLVMVMENGKHSYKLQIEHSSRALYYSIRQAHYISFEVS
jgi:hypothetical protein